MNLAATVDFERRHNPVDLVEQLASGRDWSFERSEDDEISMIVTGAWCDYHLSLTWRDDLETLHLACAFDLRAGAPRMGELYRLIARINEKLWLGHFDIWTGEGMILFRHALILNGADPTAEQCEALLAAALDACERHYQAFQFVVWAGRSAEEALSSAVFETHGHA
jgi:hypothetical protein